MAKIVLALHGGAEDKSIDKNNVSDQLKFLEEILMKGHAALQKSATAVEVVEQVVRALENHPDFNAGMGAALTKQGTIELDAAIMDGKTKDAGAVASVRHIKNPITAARMVLTQSKHLLLVGQSAEDFCLQHGIELVDPDYFVTAKQYERWQANLPDYLEHSTDTHLGTVGAVALDQAGNLAAATSTGGVMHQLPGRVGDSPIIGAGTWADNRTCAISVTGQGEALWRVAFSHNVHAQMLYANAHLADATAQTLQELKSIKGRGGCIALDNQGKVSAVYNTRHMYHGSVDSDGKVYTAV